MGLIKSRLQLSANAIQFWREKVDSCVGKTRQFWKEKVDSCQQTPGSFGEK